MTPETIFTQEPGKYHAQKTVGGWVVVFIEDRGHARNVDGGKVHESRQNAYAKAQRLNDSIPADHLIWYYVDQKDDSCGQYVQATNKIDAIRQAKNAYGQAMKTWRIKECDQAPE